MTWYRSWPSWFDTEELYFGAPEHLQDRPFVWDNLPRIRMQQWDYMQTEWWPDEDVFLLEWDVALDRQGREGFEVFALEEPEQIAAAYYHLSDGRTILGMGCIYLPLVVVNAFKEDPGPSGMWSDTSLFKWYRKGGTRGVRASPYTFPQHLNS